MNFMMTATLTMLFLALLAYGAWYKKWKVLSLFLILLSLYSFYVLYQAEKKLYDLSDASVGERRSAIVNMSIMINSGMGDKELEDSVYELSKDGVFSNKDYDSIAHLLNKNVIKEVNSHYSESESEEKALLSITNKGINK